MSRLAAVLPPARTMAHQTQATYAISRILREPTLHFMLIAALLFAISSLLGLRNRNLVEVSRDEIAIRVAELEAARGAPLTDEERQQVDESYIRQAILVKEALALGLEEDAVIDDILAQKMLHVLSGDVIQPTDVEVEEYYETNQTRYTSKPAVTVNEIVVATAGPLPAALSALLRDGTPPEQLTSDLRMSESVMSDVTTQGLTRIFGAETAALVFSAEPGVWVGPHHTARGQHWFQIRERSDSSLSPLEMIRDRVRLDWIREYESTRLEQRFTDIRKRYNVVFTDGNEGL